MILSPLLLLLLEFSLFATASLTAKEQDILEKIAKYYKKDAFPADFRNRASGKGAGLCTEALALCHRQKRGPDPSSSDPLKIKLQISILGFEMTPGGISVSLSLRLQWFDQRLNLPPAKVRPKFKLPPSIEVWKPDILFRPSLNLQSEVITLAAVNSSLEWTTHWSGTVSCAWNPDLFPFETRHCGLSLIGEDGLTFFCLKGLCVNNSAASAPSDFHLHLRHSLTETETGEPSVSVAVSAGRTSFAWLAVSIFCPSLLLLLLVWLAAFVVRRTVRAVVSTASLLALIFLWAVERSAVQTKSMLSLVDVWLFACFLLVALSIIEFLVFHSRRLRANDDDDDSTASSNVVGEAGLRNKRKLLVRRRRRRRTLQPHSVFLVAFPVCVCIFCLCYFLTAVYIRQNAM